MLEICNCLLKYLKKNMYGYLPSLFENNIYEILIMKCFYVNNSQQNIKYKHFRNVRIMLFYKHHMTKIKTKNICTKIPEILN